MGSQMPSKAALQWMELTLPGWSCSVLREEGGKHVATVWSPTSEEFTAIRDDPDAALWAAMAAATGQDVRTG